ncbi:hypothetical protein [Lacticaseibacillus sp. N501-2]|uniref:hypothetical protein n=1 Tax=Lacticaseibacillus salsurae TaxID=3367729 RepID=UPI0038B3993F
MKQVPAKIFKQHMDHYMHQITRYGKPIHVFSDDPGENAVVMSERAYDDMMATLTKLQQNYGQDDHSSEIRPQGSLIYPVIMHEINDADGHYFTATSPNIPGMVIQGDNRDDTAAEAINAIATLLDGEPYPGVQDPTTWHLEPNETIAYIPVNMTRWLEEKGTI